MSANSWAISWQCLCLSRVPLNKQVDSWVPWPCSRGLLSHHPLASCTWKLEANVEDVGQTLHLVNVVKILLLICASFGTLGMQKLVVRQVEADDWDGLLDASSVFLQHFGVPIGRWSFLGSVHNVPKMHRCRQHFKFELPKVEVLSIELVNDSSGLVMKWCYCTFEYTLKTLKLAFLGLQSTQFKVSTPQNPLCNLKVIKSLGTRFQ
jgi:hypothetical protein